MKRPAVLILLVLLMLGIIVARQSRRISEATLPEGTRVLDFYEAIGIEQTELARFLETASQSGDGLHYPLLIRLRNRHGDCLVDGRVIVRWQTGEYRLLVGKSGVLRFSLAPENLPGLKLIVPQGYEHFEQSTIPLGSRYQAEEDADATGWIGDVIYDGEITSNLVQQLRRIRASGEVVEYDAWQQQLRRRQPEQPIRLPTLPLNARPLTAAEIYQQRRRSVVVIAQLSQNGTLTHAGGVVLSPEGVVATAYHVLDKTADIVARGVRLADGSVHPIVEILAADPTADVALLRIAAQNLEYCPLSPGDVPGTPVTIISHPSSRFFTLTQGHISRYSAVILYGRSTIVMSVTAEFADGSSGSPVFNSHGFVAGLVSSTESARDQMVFRSVVPAQTIQRLLGSPTGS